MRRNHQGRVLDISETWSGSETSSAHVSGALTLLLYDTSDFSDEGGQVEIDGAVYSYLTKDDDLSTLTLYTGLIAAVDSDVEVYIYPRALEKEALVQIDDAEDCIAARVPHHLVTVLENLVRNDTEEESVLVSFEDGEYVIHDVIGKTPQLDGQYLTPGSVSQEAVDVEVTTSPTPVVQGGIRLLHVTWEPVEGTNVEVKVHVSTVPGFVAGPTNLVKSVSGTSTTIEALADGTPLVPETLYYVRLQAVNSISQAPVSAEVSGSLRQIDTPDINVDAIWAGTITADRIRAGGLQVTVDLEAGGVVRARGASGQKIEFAGGEGFLVAGPDSLGNPTYIFFPTDGRPNIISGTTQATTLSVDGDPTTGQAATFRRNSQIEPGATFSLNDSIVAPIGSPVAETISDEAALLSIGTLDNQKALTYRASDHSLYAVNTDGTLYRHDIAAETTTLVTDLVYGATDYLPRGITWLGAYLIVLFENPANGDLYLSRHDPAASWASVAGLSLGQPGGHAASEDTQVLATDGTDLWIGLRDGTNAAIRFHRYLGTLASAARQETVTTTLVLAQYSTGIPELLSLSVGAMDFGATKFVLTYTETFQNPVGRPPYLPKGNIAVFSSTGTRESSNEFPLMRGTIEEWVAWDSTNTKFIGFSQGTRTRYTNIKLSGKTQSFYVGSTFHRASDSAETTLSPQTTLTMNSRWLWKVTASSPPGGLGSRIYIGTAAGSTNGKLQTTLAAAATTFTGSTYDSAGAAPPTTSTFGPTTPAIVQSQRTIDRVISTTTTSGSTTMTGTGFADYLVGKVVSGTGIAAGTTVAAVASATSLTLSQPATSSATASRTFKLPKLEIRGDGYARLTELERVILSSITDADTTAGNEPPLRVGNVAGVHLRVDGNEIQAMAGDAAAGGLLLQQGGGNVNMAGASGVVMGGKTLTAWNWDTTTITTNAAGEANISHGLGGTPATVTACVANTGSGTYRISVTALSATTFTVEARRSDTNAVAPSGTSVGVRWFAVR